jgi:hypothetical protein
MSPEQYRDMKAAVEWLADQLYREKAHLLYYRVIHAQDRIDRGNRLPAWDWPHERRPRQKWTANNE